MLSVLRTSRCQFRVKLRNTQTEHSSSRLPPTADIARFLGWFWRTAYLDHRDIGKLPPVGAAPNRRQSHIIGFWRVIGSGVILPRRKSAHLHRPWRGCSPSREPRLSCWQKIPDKCHLRHGSRLLSIAINAPQECQLGISRRNASPSGVRRNHTQMASSVQSNPVIVEPGRRLQGYHPRLLRSQRCIHR